MEIARQRVSDLSASVSPLSGITTAQLPRHSPSPHTQSRPTLTHPFLRGESRALFRPPTAPSTEPPPSKRPFTIIMDSTETPTDANCTHRGASHCRLDSPVCCACADTRPHQSTYVHSGRTCFRTARRWSCYCVPCADFWEYQVHHARLAPSHSRIPDFPVPDTSSAWPGPDASAASTSRSAKRRAAKKARKERYTEPDDAERQCREREVERERLVELVGAARDRYRRAYERWKEFAAAGLGDVVMEDGGSSSGCSGSRPAARPPDGDGSDYGTCGLFRMLSTPAFTAPASPLPSASTPSPLCVPDEWPDTDTDTDDDDDNTPHPSFDPSWFFAASTTPPLPHMTLIPPASLGLAEETALVLELLSKAGTVEMELPTQEVSLLRVCENTARLRREAGVAAPVAVRVDGACVVCCDGPADAVLLPCRHLVMCEMCYDHVLAGESECGRGVVMCPVCRTQVEETIKIFRG